ncbi:MAG: hypothetical protein RL198_134 [Actinomycetota bacterium]
MRKVTDEQLKQVFAGLDANPRVVASGNFATPRLLLELLDTQVERFRLHMLLAQKGIPDRDGVEYETAFVGPGMRNHPRLHYIPCRLSLVPTLFHNHYPPDVVLLHTSRLIDGTVSLGTEVNVLPSAIEAVRKRGGLVVAQANRQMPYTYGDAQIYEHEIDYLVEVDEPIEEKPSIAISEDASRIGSLIASRIESGSTLQLGIGAIPDSVLMSLGNSKDLRIWTEMFSDGVLNLHKSGVLDPESTITASFVFGSRELYDWLDRNRKVRMLRTERTNNPAEIAKQVRMTSINSALQVDLFDQANASRVRGRIYSGIGGSTDFIVGSLHSRGGASYMALPSWHPKAQVSTIVPVLEENVTSFQHSFVVTENGIASCFGRSESEQAANLIERAAHPSVRDDLWRAAEAHGLGGSKPTD